MKIMKGYKEIIKQKFENLKKENNDLVAIFKDCNSMGLKRIIKENEKMLNVMNAYLDGKRIEYYDKISKRWMTIKLPSFSEKYKYRVAK